jgi:hypothetical protein
MSCLMRRAPGDPWDGLAPALKAHYREGSSVETGLLTIEFPRAMRPVLWALRGLGALLDRAGRDVPTRVERKCIGEGEYWRRTLRYPDGTTLRFDTVRVPAREGRLIEFVNPLLGLEFAPRIVGSQMHYRGVRFVLRLADRDLTIPQWLALGTASIIEQAIDDQLFFIDFRLRHPILGEWFRYSGTFRADV